MASESRFCLRFACSSTAFKKDLISKINVNKSIFFLFHWFKLPFSVSKDSTIEDKASCWRAAFNVCNLCWNCWLWTNCSISSGDLSELSLTKGKRADLISESAKIALTASVSKASPKSRDACSSGVLIFERVLCNSFHLEAEMMLPDAPGKDDERLPLQKYFLINI